MTEHQQGVLDRLHVLGNQLYAAGVRVTTKLAKDDQTVEELDLEDEVFARVHGWNPDVLRRYSRMTIAAIHTERALQGDPSQSEVVSASKSALRAYAAEHLPNWAALGESTLTPLSMETCLNIMRARGEKLWLESNRGVLAEIEMQCISFAKGTRRGWNPRRVMEYARMLCARLTMQQEKSASETQLAEMRVSLIKFRDDHMPGWREEKLDESFFMPTHPLQASGTPRHDVDARRRILAFADCVEHAREDLLQVFYRDIERFEEAARMGKYTQAEIGDVRTALMLTVENAVAERERCGAAIARLERTEREVLAGRMPLQMRALEQQFSAYRFNELVTALSDDDLIKAAQPTTSVMLKEASAYCWSRACVDAVASAAASLPDDVKLLPETLGALDLPGTSGWWFFDEPIPIQTLTDDQKPVCAVGWRRQKHANGMSSVWFSCFVHEDMRVGRPIPGMSSSELAEVPIPSTAWTWLDGTSLEELPAALTRGYQSLYGNRHEIPKSGLEVTVKASVWFSAFFLSACAWLQQKIAALEPAQGVRNAVRRLERQHKLKQPTLVHIVHLRRRETLHRAKPEEQQDQDGKRREYTCQWVVHGFWRNQWYASRGTHELKWIGDYIKGPEDKPLRTRQTVYAVER